MFAATYGLGNILLFIVQVYFRLKMGINKIKFEMLLYNSICYNVYFLYVQVFYAISYDGDKLITCYN